MPTYEYECAACSHRFEQFQSITAEPVKTCPSCGKRRVRRLLGTGGALIFKGSGFYATDYRSPSYQEAAKKESSQTAEKTPGGEKTSCHECSKKEPKSCPKTKVG